MTIGISLARQNHGWVIVGFFVNLGPQGFFNIAHHREPHDPPRTGPDILHGEGETKCWWRSCVEVVVGRLIAERREVVGLCWEGRNIGSSLAALVYRLIINKSLG